MAKGTIKAEVQLRFERWLDADEVPEVELVGDPDEFCLDTVIAGSIELAPSKLYQIMKADKEGNKLPMFSMVIVDPEEMRRRAELKRLQEEKEESPELDLSGEVEKAVEDIPDTEANDEVDADQDSTGGVDLEPAHVIVR